jgi:uncharacterized protein YcfJ
MKSILTATFFALTSAPVMADGYAHNHNLVTILEVIPQFVQHPRETVRQVCYQEQVPVRRYSDGGDVLTGALIGAAIGNQFGSGSGNDAMTILGAIVGANSGSKSRPVVGYEVVHNCRNEVTVEYVEEFSHFSVIFLENGKRYRTQTRNNYFVGDRVPSHQLR